MCHVHSRMKYIPNKAEHCNLGNCDKDSKKKETKNNK